MARPPAIGRRQNARAAVPTIWVFCEGGNTEPEYFESFANEHGNAGVRLKLIGKAGTPVTLVDKAIAKRRELRSDPMAAGDEVWAAFDRDEHDYVAEALARARDAGVKTAFTNPCFELWALLHLEDYTRGVDRHAMQRRLQSQMKGYDHDSAARLNYPLMSPHFETAFQRATAMLQRRHDEADPTGNPSTTVHLLTEVIVKLGDPQKVLVQQKAAEIRRRHGKGR